MDTDVMSEATTVLPNQDVSYPPLVDENNAYDDIYHMPEDLDNPTPRTLDDPPDTYHPIMKALHYYFGELYIQIEFYCHEHYVYILIGLAVFLFLVVIPGVCAQIYCDRLYRKYKREAITRKILEVEAQLQCTLELEAELDNEDNRPDRRHYESTSSDTDSSYDRKRDRKHRKRNRKNKSSKKVRSKSRNRRKDRNSDEEKAKYKMELMELEASQKQKEAELKLTKKQKMETIETKVSQENHRRHHPDSGFSNNTTTTELFNDKPPTYSSKKRPTSAAIQTGSLFEESVHEILPHYDDCIELTRQTNQNPSGEFLIQEPNQSEQVPQVKEIPVASATIKHDIIKKANPRSAFWSAGVIQQFNGVKTPPIPKKTVKKEATPPAAQVIKEAVAHNAAPIKYEEIGLMNTMYNSGETRNRPTDYNSALLSITHKNDDVIGAHRAHQAQISELMPPPTTTPTTPQLHQPSSLEPTYRSPTPPPIPIKESKKKSALKAMDNVPDMEMGRTFHSNAAPTNDYEGEILDKSEAKTNKKVPPRTTVLSRTTSKEVSNSEPVEMTVSTSLGGETADDLTTTLNSSVTHDFSTMSERTDDTVNTAIMNENA